MTNQPVRAGLALTAIAVGALAFALLSPFGRGPVTPSRPDPKPRPALSPMEAFRGRLSRAANPREQQWLLAGLSRRDPIAALNLAEAIGATPMDKYILAAGVVAAEADSTSLPSWNWLLLNSDRLTPEGLDPLLGVYLRTVAAHEPQGVVRLVDGALQSGGPSCDSGVLVTSAVTSLLASGHADIAQQAISQWSERFGSEAIPPAAASSAALSLASSESPQQAADWLGTLPASDAREQAIAALAAEWTNHDPQSAMAWTLKLPADAGVSAASRALNAWMDRDPAAANAWLQQRTLR